MCASFLLIPQSPSWFVALLRDSSAKGAGALPERQPADLLTRPRGPRLCTADHVIRLLIARPTWLLAALVLYADNGIFSVNPVCQLVNSCLFSTLAGSSFTHRETVACHHGQPRILSPLVPNRISSAGHHSAQSSCQQNHSRLSTSSPATELSMKSIEKEQATTFGY